MGQVVLGLRIGRKDHLLGAVERLPIIGVGGNASEQVFANLFVQSGSRLDLAECLSVLTTNDAVDATLDLAQLGVDAVEVILASDNAHYLKDGQGTHDRRDPGVREADVGRELSRSHVTSNAQRLPVR